MPIWLRAREKFADNRFQLLFIYIDRRGRSETCQCGARSGSPQLQRAARGVS